MSRLARDVEFLRRPRTFASIATFMCMSATVAFAQSGKPIHDGHALDANPRVGSGGYNTPGSYYELNAANRFITGNATGLSTFHAASPITDPSLFRAGLGSAGLTFFNRQSVSLGDVLNRRTDAGLPFYAREPTIVGSGGIAARINQPGSSVPLSTGNAPGTGRLIYRPALAPVSESDLRRQGQATAVNPVDAAGAATFVPYDSLRLLESLSSAYTQASASTLFGVGKDAGLTVSPLMAAIGQAPSRQTTDESLPSGLYSRLLGTLQDDAQEADLSARARARLLERASPAQRDAIGEMLARASQRAGGELQTSEVSRSDEARNADAAARVSKSLLESATIGTFAEDARNPVDSLIQSGERCVREGRYYDAARYFAAATAMDASNPLPRLARGHALAAAGDYRSASRDIAAGLRLMPGVAMLDIDLARLMGGPDVCRLRISDLSKQLERNDDYELRFLLGYLRYHSGDPARGVADLLSAARAAPARSVISEYPRMLAGRS